MCGICGIIGPAAPDTPARVRAMMDRMAHRGPDGDGVWQSAEGRVTLGHVRLAIQDTSDAGAQPMHHPADLHQTVNGEFYNYPELRRSFAPDTQFASDCDSEILLHGYARKGADFVPDLAGMFAFALYDARKGKVLLGRDRLGIKPLYFLVHGGELIFASEIKALFAAIPATDWAIDLQGLTEFLTYQSALGGNTLFRGIRQVLPGHVMTVPVERPDAIRSDAFWQARPTPDADATFSGACEAFEDTFQYAVRRHLLSDVPVASYLSAGLDSASVFTSASAIARATDGHPLTAFTGRFDMGSNWYDETGPAGVLASVMAADHQRVAICEADLPQHLDDVIGALDEPRMGMGAFSQYMVARAAAEDYKVILTGHGGDELFSGYPVFAHAEFGLTGMRRCAEAPHFAYFTLSDLQGRFVPELGRGLPVLWSVRQQARMLGVDTASLRPWEQIDTWTAPARNRHDEILLTYLNAYLPGLLIVEDKISMAHGLEARTPILDNDLIDLSLRIPGRVKLQDRRLKAIIRNHAASHLPQTYLSQPKRGFPTPLRHWLRGGLAHLVRDRLARSDGHLQTLFKPDLLANVVDSYQSSWRRHVRPLDEIQSHRMWQLLSLEAWLRIWSERYGVTLRLP